MGEVACPPASATSLREAYERDGFVVVRGLLPRADVMALRAHAESLLRKNGDASARPYMQTAFDDQGAAKVIKLSGLADRDPRFAEIATRDSLVDVVETLIGAGSRRFRDVLITKPGRTGGVFSYHQDSAFWDVEPKALVSAWISLGDVTADSGCLSVVPGTQTRFIEHGLYLRGRYAVPRPITRALRRLVSLTGTGDNPDTTTSRGLVWRVKRWLLADTTKYLPVLYDLQDFRVPLDMVDTTGEVLLPVAAGDVIFFHSLLWHASGPNRSESMRFAEIISFMGPAARFIGRGARAFPLARRA